MTIDNRVSLDMRTTGTWNMIIQIYVVPEDVLQRKIEKVLFMNY